MRLPERVCQCAVSDFGQKVKVEHNAQAATCHLLTAFVGTGDANPALTC